MMKIKLLSWNIWGGIMFPGILRYLAETNADIVALQEVCEEEGSNTAEKLAERLGYQYCYAYNMDCLWEGKATRRGNAILSKYPIRTMHRYILSSVLPRTVIRGDIAIGNSVLHVISIHLVPHFPDTPHLQREQVTSLVRELPKEKTVIMGDMNNVPTSEPLTVMTQYFTDSDVRGVPTWCLYPDGPAHEKKESVVWKYDYILSTSDLCVTDFAVGTSNASDHLPVIAMLTLPE